MPKYGTAFSPAEPDELPLRTVPEVAAALDGLIAATDRWQGARERQATAWAAAQRAPQEDASAAIEAVSKGVKLPPLAAKRAEDQYEEACRVTEAAEALALAAEDELLEAVETHRDALRAAQRDRLETALDAVDTALAALEQAMTEAGLEAARLITVGNSEHGRPLSTSNPLRWDIYDPRLDATVDAVVGLGFIARHARDMRPSTLQAKEIAAQAEWSQVIDGTQMRPVRHRLPDGDPITVYVPR